MNRWKHRFYQVALFFKGADGVLETVGGALFLLNSSEALRGWIGRVTGWVLARDPDDAVARLLRHAFTHLTGSRRVFAGVYLLGHGLVKAAIVIALLRRRPWAFIVGIAVLVLFIAYQIFRWFHTHSLTLAAVTVLDAVIAALVWGEYRRLRSDTGK